MLIDELREKIRTDKFELSKHAVDLVENVPARVNPETGEQFFAPATVERLHEVILKASKPRRVIETPVYEYGE